MWRMFSNLEPDVPEVLIIIRSLVPSEVRDFAIFDSVIRTLMI